MCQRGRAQPGVQEAVEETRHVVGIGSDDQIEVKGGAWNPVSDRCHAFDHEVPDPVGV